MFTILTYHSIDDSRSVVSVAPRTFAGHMECLAEIGFRGISLREAVSYRETRGCWPERCVALTFDDGFANFFEVAFPVLTSRGFSATLFLVSAHIGGQNDWEVAPLRLGKREMLSWRQVTRLARSGIEIGAHTRSHTKLSSLSERQLNDEIAGSRADIYEHLGELVDSFAYPYGCFNEASLALVKREFKAACTTVLRRCNDDELHLLPRIDMYYFGSRSRLEKLLAGRLDHYLAVRRWGRSLRRGRNADRSVEFQYGP